MEVSEADGVTPTAIYFPFSIDGKLSGWKARSLTDKKAMWAVGTMKGAGFFGWDRAIRSGSRTLFITEGEFDAIALYQILKDSNKHTEYADQKHAVVSIPNGAGGAKKTINTWLPEIRKHFDDVVLVFDMDEPGQKAAEEVCKIAPNFKTANLPCKDANECLMEGASKACKSAVIFRSAHMKNTRLVFGSTLREAARQQAQPGLSTPWTRLTEATRGIRRGETWYWGAGVKMGKSELVNALGAHMIKEHNQRIFMAKPEEAVTKSYKMLCGKMVGKIFHDPNIPFDYEAFDAADELVGDMVIFQDIYQFVGWDNLKEDMRYACVAEGVHDFFIDPITCLTNSMSASDANEHLTLVAAEASAMAKDLAFTVHLFCHLKAPLAGEPHERGGKVLSTQMAGSRAMMRSCNYMIGMEGNKDPDLEREERNMRTLKILEDREFGVSESIPLYWDYHTGMFNEIRN
jgi:twinkle protein